MEDFFKHGNSARDSQQYLNDIFESIYGWKPKSTNVFFAFNFRWDKYELPLGYRKYFFSSHTEQIPSDWLMTQAQRVYPCPVMVPFDGIVPESKLWPDNVIFVRWTTWHLQIDKLINKFGLCQKILRPKYKISSLSFRISQYKKFVTAYLLQHADPKSTVLTWHNWLGKQEDNHNHPFGIEYLNNLNLNMPATFLNFDDNFEQKNNTPVSNGDWNSLPYNDALVNLTNESFHYSKTIIDNEPFIFPGPYLTEKTWKPLLAGRPFLVVGQYLSYQELARFGLKFDFGFDISYDQDPGDLTRIGLLFKSLQQIIDTDIDTLYNASYDSVAHNLNILVNQEFQQCCRELNQLSVYKIKDFLDT